MSARLIVTLFAAVVLSGCATTANNFAPKAVLLDDGSYYFPAQSGNGDYYYEAPERRSAFSVEFGFGFGHFPSFSHRYCSPRDWHCPPWAYWPGHGNGYGYGWPYYGHRHFGGWSFDNFRDRGVGQRWQGDHRRGDAQPESSDEPPRRQPPRPDRRRPDRRERPASGDAVDHRQPEPLPRRASDDDEKPVHRNGGYRRQVLDREETAVGASTVHGDRDASPSPRRLPTATDDAPARERIRERDHDRDDE